MTVRVIIVAIAMITGVTGVIALASAFPRETQSPSLAAGAYEPCRTPAERMNAQCLGYVLGIYDTMQAVQASGGRLLGLRACPAPGIPDEELRDVVASFMTAHPESPRSSVPGQFAKALSDAFPCQPAASDDVSRRFRAMPAIDPG
jgi:hypothetical protein